MQPDKPVILVVDDDPVNLDILVRTLERDYFLIIAKNGKRALELAAAHRPDLILLDILMPPPQGKQGNRAHPGHLPVRHGSAGPKAPRL